MDRPKILPSELLKKNGWRQYSAGLPNGPNCIVGIVTYAFGFNMTEVKRDFFVRIIEILSVKSIADWNDTPGRTMEEVVTVLEKVEAEMWPQETIHVELERELV